MNEIRIKPKSKGVNLNCNAPLTSEIKVIRYERNQPKQMQQWYVEHANQEVRSDTPPIDCENAAKLESIRVQEELIHKRTRLQQCKTRLHERLQDKIQKKKQSLEILMAQYHQQSMESHAPQKLISKKIPVATYPNRQLSVEDLDISALPVTRNYMVYPQEKYTLVQQYFSTDTIGVPEYNQDIEKQLRTSYRVGHLDEIKRKEFGKYYKETREYFMDLERFKLLETKKKKKPKSVHVIYQPQKYMNDVLETTTVYSNLNTNSSPAVNNHRIKKSGEL